MADPLDALADLAHGADLLVREATYLDDEQAASAQGHMTASQAGELAARVHASRLLLTHTIVRTPDAESADLTAVLELFGRRYRDVRGEDDPSSSRDSG